VKNKRIVILSIVVLLITHLATYFIARRIRTDEYRDYTLRQLAEVVASTINGVPHVLDGQSRESIRRLAFDVHDIAFALAELGNIYLRDNPGGGIHQVATGMHPWRELEELLRVGSDAYRSDHADLPDDVAVPSPDSAEPLTAEEIAFLARLLDVFTAAADLFFTRSPDDGAAQLRDFDRQSFAVAVETVEGQLDTLLGRT
jgi:hypothetical protein